MKQSCALDILKAGHSVFLTGQAGAGKTHTLNAYIRYLRKNNIYVAVTASTGIAATHMGGMTIHAWSGIGIRDKMDDALQHMLTKNERFVQKLKKVSVLIIDEISMLHAHQLDLVDEVLRFAVKNDSPFGGKQVVFSGDFFQLPPIGKKHETTRQKFAFMSKAWITLANMQKDGIGLLKVCYLSEQHRQKGSKESDAFDLNDILNQMRTQNVSDEAIKALLDTRTHDIDKNSIQLYTHNANVDAINQKELDALAEKSRTYIATTEGVGARMDMLVKSVRSPKELVIKKGAKVMFTKNHQNQLYSNGTLGQVVDFVRMGKHHYPKVCLLNGEHVIAEPEEWTVEDEAGQIAASFVQVPLCLAWAITVHKSQGMTLESAVVDLSKTFETGQGYVALSRVKSLDGLKLLGLNANSLLLDDFARTANRRFLQLSQQCQIWRDDNADLIWQQQQNFIAKHRSGDENDSKQGGQKTDIKPIKLNDGTKNTIKSAPKKILDSVPTRMNTDDDLILLIKQQALGLKAMAAKLGCAQTSLVTDIKQLVYKQRLDVRDIDYLKNDTQASVLAKTQITNLTEAVSKKAQATTKKTVKKPIESNKNSKKKAAKLPKKG